MKKPVKYISSHIELEFDDYRTFGEIIKEFENEVGRELTMEELKSITIEKGTFYGDYTESDALVLLVEEGENPNFEQQMKEYTQHLKIQEAKNLVSETNMQYITNLEAMAKSSRAKIEQAQEFLKGIKDE